MVFLRSFILISFIYFGMNMGCASNFSHDDTVGYVCVPVADLIAPDVRFTLEESSVVQAARVFAPELFDQLPAYRRSQLLYGERVLILEEKNGWYRIRAPEQIVIDDDGARGCHGWIRANHVLVGVKQVENELVVVRRQVCVCAKPSIGSEELFKFSCGTRLSGMAHDKAWHRIDLLDGRQGFVATRAATSLRDFESLTDDEKRALIVAGAQQFIDVPYVWGGRNALGIDCSALTQLAHLSCGITIPRYAHGQWKACKSVQPKDLKVGDLVFLGAMRDEKLVMVHVMLYVGHGMLLEASGFAEKVRTVRAVERLGKSLHELNNGAAVSLRRFVFCGSFLV